MSKILVTLSQSQRNRINRLMHTTSNKIEALRCRIVLLLDEKLAVNAVTKLAGCVRATVYRTVYRFEDSGEEGLFDGRKRRIPLKVSADVVEQLLEYLDGVPKDYGWQRSAWTLELFSRQLFSDTGVSLSTCHIWRVLKREGCRRGRPRPALRIPIRGRRQILDNIERLVARASPCKEVFYVDEADIDLNPRIGLTYIRRGHQPLVLTPGKNVKYYIAGALNVRTGRVLYSHGPKKNSTLFVDMLDVLCRAYRRARNIHIVLDNYIIHKSRYTLEALEAMRGRIQLHFLPPYSPEHNPIEGLWKQLHDNVTRNHRHKTMPSLWCDVVNFLDRAQPFPGTSITTAKAA